MTTNHLAYRDDPDFTYETSTHLYIIKLWMEESQTEQGRSTWRGHITDIPKGERGVVRSLDDIVDFIGSRLESKGVQTCLCWKCRKLWLRFNALLRTGAITRKAGIPK